MSCYVEKRWWLKIVLIEECEGLDRSVLVCEWYMEQMTVRGGPTAFRLTPLESGQQCWQAYSYAVNDAA